MTGKKHLLIACTLLLASAMSYAQTPAGERPWDKQKVQGRDEVLRSIENQARENADTTVQEVRNVIYDYEVDMYRLVLDISKHYGPDAGYQLMGEAVSEKRLRWLDQRFASLNLTGNDVEKGLELYRSYFQPQDSEFKIVEKTDAKVVLMRKDYVNAIHYACDKLGLDPVEVNNKVYAPTMTQMLARINPALKHSFLKYEGDGWYEEQIDLTGK